MHCSDSPIAVTEWIIYSPTKTISSSACLFFLNLESVPLTTICYFNRSQILNDIVWSASAFWETPHCRTTHSLYSTFIPAKSFQRRSSAFARASRQSAGCKEHADSTFLASNGKHDVRIGSINNLFCSASENSMLLFCSFVYVIRSVNFQQRGQGDFSWFHNWDIGKENKTCKLRLREHQILTSGYIIDYNKCWLTCYSLGL